MCVHACVCVCAHVCDMTGFLIYACMLVCVCVYVCVIRQDVYMQQLVQKREGRCLYILPGTIDHTGRKDTHYNIHLKGISHYTHTTVLHTRV